MGGKRSTEVQIRIVSPISITKPSISDLFAAKFSHRHNFIFDNI